MLAIYSVISNRHHFFDKRHSLLNLLHFVSSTNVYDMSCIKFGLQLTCFLSTICVIFLFLKYNSSARKAIYAYAS